MEMEDVVFSLLLLLLFLLLLLSLSSGRMSENYVIKVEDLK